MPSFAEKTCYGVTLLCLNLVKRDASPVEVHEEARMRELES